MGTQPPFPERGRNTPISAYVYCRQTDAWIKMPLCTEVGLGPDDIVLDGDPAPLSQKWAEPPLPIFGPFLLWPNGWMHQDTTWYGGRIQPRRLCVRWGPNPPPQKGAEPPIFFPRLLWPNCCMDQDATCYGGGVGLRDIVLDGDPTPPPLQGHSLQFSANVRCGQTAG